MGTDDLEDNDDGPYSHKSWVGEHSFKNVELIIDFSGTDHVEDLHEDKKVEDDCEVT